MINRELVSAYLEHCRTYYGEGPRTTTAAVELAVKPLLELFGDVEGLDLSQLKKVRQALLYGDLARSTINARIDKIVRLYRWAEVEQLVEPGVWQQLRTLPHLKRGRSTAREPEKRRPASDQAIQATLDRLPPLLADMVRIQYYTGCRSGSLVQAKGGEFTTEAGELVWRPHHKTEYLGHELELPIGPRCLRILRPYLKKPGSLFIHRRGGTYSPWSYRKQIERTQTRHHLPKWTPHQLRHARAVKVRAEMGVEAAQAVLGHKSITATQIYAGRQFGLAREAARRMG